MTDQTAQSHCTFTHPELPDIEWRLERGSGGDPGLPSTWMTLVGTRQETPAPTDDIPNPDPITVEVARIGFAGP